MPPPNIYAGDFLWTKSTFVGWAQDPVATSRFCNISPAFYGTNINKETDPRDTSNLELGTRNWLL